MLALAAQCNQQ